MDAIHHGLAGGLVAFVLAVVFGLLRATANERALRDAATGTLMLVYGMPARVIAVGGAIAMPLLLAAVSYVVPFENAVQKYAIVGAGAGFAALGGILLLICVKSRVVVSNTDVVEYEPLARPKRIAWAEVERVEYSASGMVALVGPRKNRVRINCLLRGIREFADVLEQRLPPAVRERSDKAISALHAYLAR